METFNLHELPLKIPAEVNYNVSILPDLKVHNFQFQLPFVYYNKLFAFSNLNYSIMMNLNSPEIVRYPHRKMFGFLNGEFAHVNVLEPNVGGINISYWGLFTCNEIHCICLQQQDEKTLLMKHFYFLAQIRDVLPDHVFEFENYGGVFALSFEQQIIFDKKMEKMQLITNWTAGPMITENVR